MVPQQSRLLGLPRELRDHIYREYIFSGAEEGYIYDFPAGKLRTATGRPIDLNLMYTCRRIAAEMQGLALGLQTITFSTLYSEDVRVRAGFWETIIEEGRYNKYDLDKLAPMMAEDMTEEVARRYRGTHFYDAFCRRRTEDVARFGWGREGALGDVPSVFRRMTNDVMQLAVTDPAIYEAKAEEGYYKYRKRCDPSVRARLGEKPWELWKIPTALELDALAKQVFITESDIWTRENYRSAQAENGMCRFSAAAAAIHFLSSIPSSRRHIREIILDEDRESVAHPECHARGLIPFCQENPHLRIERRVSLWRNLFLTCHPNWSGGVNHLWMVHSCVTKDRDQLLADYVTRRVAEYMVEASVPEMPEAITLVLDGDPLPELASYIFRDAVQRDAAWQTALDRTFTAERGARPVDVFYKRASQMFFFVGFPELLRDMCQQQAQEGAARARAPVPGRPRCRVRCNFDPGEPWDDGRIAAEIEEPNRDRAANLDEWEEPWQRDVSYQTTPPLPKYHLLFDETVLPIPWSMPED